MPVYSRAEGVAVKLFLKTSVIAAVIALMAACGGSTFELFPDTESDTPANTAPMANAGAAQAVLVGATVTLNGSASSDVNGDTLTYSWSITSKPSSSTAALSSATVVNPTFTADLAGSFILSLTVNDGKAASSASTVTITAAAATANVAPVANAGPAQSVLISDVVVLNGSGSSDANGDALTYSWTITSKPSSSTAALSSATVVNPTFTADVVGPYILSLIVNDGKVSSPAATVTVTAYNSPPTANAGPDQSGVVVGTIIQLNGSGSSGAIQRYNWNFTARPTGAGNDSLSSATVVNPTFTPTVAGTYVIQLQVSNTRGGTTDTVSITVTPSNTGSITVTW